MSKSRNAQARNTIRAKMQGKRDGGASGKLQRKPSRTRGTAPGGSDVVSVGKLAFMVRLLRRPGGATIEELAKGTGWQKHSVRGAISGALKKKRGLTVTSAAESGGARVYRIAG
jgi:hypothetical protein